MTDKASAIRPDMVRPLVWSENDTNWWGAVAGSFPFTYEVRLTDSGKVRTRTGTMAWVYFSGSMEEARAAAQADYASRILSALSPAFIERMAALEAALEAASVELFEAADKMCVFGLNHPGGLRHGGIRAMHLNQDKEAMIRLSGRFSDASKAAATAARTTLQEHAEDGERQGDEG